MSKAEKYLEVLSNLRKIRSWAEKSFSGPSPAFIKRYVLQRNGAPDSTWVETGTFLGETTIFLSGFAKFVYSMEPDTRLFEKASRNTASFKNINVLNGPSESVLPTVLNKINGNASFWLDGHYSAENTYQGECDTPIRDELEQIQRCLPNLGKVAVLVDDVRCFNPHIPEYAGYPSIDFLVDWARCNAFNWHIEHDIFVAKNF
jgi:hypothetical protein